MSKCIVLTGGGTAGHVTPNIALIPYLLDDGWEIHYIGTENGIESQLIPPIEKVAYHTVKTGKLRRYFSLKNFTDPFRVVAGISESKKLIKQLKPNVVFAKGGFVSVPVVYGAKAQKVPVVLHESDYTCGLANKLCLSRAKTVCVSFEPTLETLKSNKGIWTGTPIRQNLLCGSKKAAQDFLQFENPEKPWILFMGGSIGSAALNQAVKDCFPSLTSRYNVIHLRGKNNLDPELENKPGYRQFDFISKELPDVFASVDLNVCRSGANTIFELLACGIPSVLVPLPKAQSRGDQILNANYFQSKGYAHILMQEDITPETLLKAIADALKDAPNMKKAMAESPAKDGTQNVLNQIYAACGIKR